MAALSEIEKLEARWAENPDGRYFAPLADAYRKAGRVDEAITVATGGLAKHPDYLSAHIVLGRCFLAKKDDASARSAFERVLALDGENIIALKSLAEIAERDNAIDDARRWLQRLLTIDAMNSEAAEDLARLGGPLEQEAGASEPAAEEAGERISFADLAPEPVAAETPPVPAAAEPEPEPMVGRRSETTQQVPAVEMPPIPRTLERPAVSADQARIAQDRTLGMDAVPPMPVPPPAEEPLPALGLETTDFVPPVPAETPAAPAPDIIPFDDKLEWGAGERQSESIHAEDIARAEATHEATASAIEFMGGAPAPETPQPPVQPPAALDSSLLESAEPARAEGAESVAEPQPEPEPMELDVVQETPARAWEGQHAASAAYEMPPVQPEVRASGPAHDLPLIMPEDVTPPEELRRPSLKQVQMVSPEPVEAASGGAELLITETMGDLYLRQGFKDQAAEVYRRLLVSRPGDAGLSAKLAAIESPPAFSASALGAEAVGSWLRRLAQAVLPTRASAPPEAPDAGPTPMEQAFQASEPEQAPAPEAAPTAGAATPSPEGSPARPATDAYSLDQIFGASGAPAAQTPPPAPPTAPANVLGASFDEFFGAAPNTETVRPKEAAPPTATRQSEDDLSAFNAWLHGLKR